MFSCWPLATSRNRDKFDKGPRMDPNIFIHSILFFNKSMQWVGIPQEGYFVQGKCMEGGTSYNRVIGQASGENDGERARMPW